MDTRGKLTEDELRNQKCLLISADTKDLGKKIDALSKSPGYCIFMDIVESTEMKREKLMKWIAQMHNTFINCKAFLSPSFGILKCIGDELMFYITDKMMSETGETPLTLFNGMCKVANENQTDFRPVKISISYCKNAYEITFIPKSKDIYGIDIDLSARLIQKAYPKEIVMNADFRNKLFNEYNKIGNKDNFPEVEKIKGPWPEKFKGFKEYIEIYKLLSSD